LDNRLQQAEAILKQKNIYPDKAINVLKPLIKKKNTPWKAYHISGYAYFLKNEFVKAKSFFSRALEAGSQNPETFYYAGRSSQLMNDFDGAAKFLKSAVEIKRDYYPAWMALGDVQKNTGMLNEALQSYGQCNRINPAKSEVALKIGQIYRDQAFTDKALEMYNIVLQMEPGNISALNEKAKLYKNKQAYGKAEELIREAQAIAPENANLKATHAEILKESGDFLKALTIYEEILDRNPEFGGARINYANILQDIGRFDEAEQNYLQANKDTPSFQETFSNYLFVQHYNPKKTKEEMFVALKQWDGIYAPENPERPVPEDTESEKRLRVGLVSGGFRKHPVGWMIVAGMEHLPKDAFELVYYSNHTQIDEVTKRLYTTATEWRMISGLSDQKVNEMIREDEIDILVELSGHAAESRLRAVAMEPAPVIVKWVGGLINTTGLKAMDYLLTDWIETPAGSEPDYVEKLVRMPDDYICFTFSPDSPDVKESPFKENGYVTFGCFNNPIKVNPVLLEKWAALMKQVPESRLFLKSKQYANAFYTRRIEELMEGFGIGKERLLFEGYSPHSELMEAYNRVDIALDPWPYSGGLTTCEALWMGVPVITLPGPTFAGRHAASHVHNAGFPEWIADSWEAYSVKVKELAADKEKLSELRAGLREKIAASPLCDAERFGAALGQAFREMWRQRADGYQNNKETREWRDHIDVSLSAIELPVSRSNGIEKADVTIAEHEEGDGMKVSPDISEPVQMAQTQGNGLSGNSDKLEESLNSGDLAGSSSNSSESISSLASGKNGQAISPAEKKPDDITEDSSSANVDEEIGKIAHYSWKRGEDNNLLVQGNHNLIYSVPDTVDVMSAYVILEQGQWYDTEVEFMMDFLQPGMQVVDAGAGFGGYALGATSKVGPEGNVYAFEPVGLMRKHLEISKIENGCSGLEVIGRPLGSTSGKVGLSKAATPELTVLEQDGSDVQVVTLDSWWDFEGNPEIDLLKVDVNGQELAVLKGADRFLAEQSPVLILSVSEAEKAISDLVEYLSAREYTFFDFIGGVGLLSPVEGWIHRDAYAQNIVGVKTERVEALKEKGWIHNENAEVAEPEVGCWKKTMKAMPWAENLLPEWGKSALVPAHENYYRALDYICAAEALVLNDDESDGGGENHSELKVLTNHHRQLRSQKANLLLVAAQELISKYNAGDGGVSVTFTLIRVLNTLGKREQAVAIMQKLMQDSKMGRENMVVSLPFLLPIPAMDKTSIRTDFSKWLMVRTIESWLALKDLTGYLSGMQQKKLLGVLAGNPEAAAELKKNRFSTLTVPGLNDQSVKTINNVTNHIGDCIKVVHICFNHVYAQSLSDLIEFVNENSDQEHYLFIEKNRAIPDFSVDLSQCKYSIFFDYRLQSDKIMKICMKDEIDAVMIHGLFFDWQKEMVKKIGSKKHIAWKLWGGDLYNPINIGKPIHDVMQFVDSVHARSKGDLEIVRNHYGDKQFCKLGYPYPGLYGKLPQNLNKDLKPVIVIGNSGDPANEHVKILQNLSLKEDIKDFRLLLPVAYNLTTDYRKLLEKTIQQFGMQDVARLHDRFIHPDEYIKIMMKARMLITAHNRQQAIGSILTSLYSGNNTFLRKEITLENKVILNPAWRFLDDYGFEAQPLDELFHVKKLSDIDQIPEKVLLKHQSIIKKKMGLENVAKDLIKVSLEMLKVTVA